MSSKSRRPIAIRALLALSLVLGVLVVSGGTPASATGANVDLGVTLTEGSGHATAGMPWAYSITVANGSGVDDSTGYTVSLDVPSGTTAGTLDPGCTDNGSTVDCVSAGLASGSSEAFNVSLNVGSGFADSGTLAAIARITGFNGDTDASNADDSSSVSTTVDRVADLSIAKDGPDGVDPLVLAGDPAGYDYTITVSSAGPSDTSFSVSDTLPDGLTLDSGSGCSASGQDVTCTGSIADGGDPVGFTVPVLVDSSVGDASVLNNDATVAATGGTDDPTSANNSTSPDGTVSTEITARADLSPTLTIGGGPFTAGGTSFGGTLKVHNGGPSDNAGGFSVNVPLPTDFVFVSGAGCHAVTGGFTCSDTGLASGSDKNFAITLRAKSSVPAATYPLTATVSSSGTIDPTPGNDASSPANVQVITQANLVMTAGTPTYPGTQTAAWANATSSQNSVIYEFTLTNNGPSDAQSVQVDTNALDTGMNLVGVCSGPTCTSFQAFPLNIGILNGNDGSPTHGAVHIRVKATADTSLRNGPLTKADAPHATSTTMDPTPGNNSASENATVWTVPSSPTDPDGRPGNMNAFFLWKQSLSDNGGAPIDHFEISVAGPTTPSVPPVDVNDSCGTNGNNNDNSTVFCTPIAPLNNPLATNPYTFSVRAHNVVGVSDAATSQSVVPSINAAAKQINSSNLSEQTGGGANPNASDKQITIQTFQAGTTGVGTLLEDSNGAGQFCAGKACVGQIVRTKLLDPHLQGIYTVTLLYDKTLVGGTGVKYTFFYDPADTPVGGQGTQLKTCPSKITTNVVPCVVTKLASGGANPALKAVVYTIDKDPTIGGRAYPK